MKGHFTNSSEAGLPMTVSTNTAPQLPSRREFVQASTGLAAAAGIFAVAPKSCAGDTQTDDSATNKSAVDEPAKTAGLIRPGDTVLFQGDSITDAGRARKVTGSAKRDQQAAFGNGYAWLATASLLVDRPSDDLTMINRGVSGNKVYQLAERWEQDCLALQPDVLSILIGVNDIWHSLNKQYQGTVDVYERDYQNLVEHTKAELPDVRLVVCEPFVLKCGAVNQDWFPEFDAYRAAARRVSDAADATFVPFQQMFDEAINYAPPTHWAKDGVHPSPAGAALMANCWLKTVNA